MKSGIESQGNQRKRPIHEEKNAKLRINHGLSRTCGGRGEGVVKKRAHFGIGMIEQIGPSTGS